ILTRWVRGNTHTHSDLSDGDSPPEEVVDWYAEHDYDFLFMTDHDVLIPGERLARLEQRGITVLQGEEITMAAVHVNGLDLSEAVPPLIRGSASVEAELARTVSSATRIRYAVEAVRTQHGLAVVNHPNYFWAVSARSVVEAGGADAIEVFNGHSAEESLGDAEHPSAEAIWQSVLDAGILMYGVASDDSHHFKRWGEAYSNPGRGWIYAEASTARHVDVLAALRAGRFYASSGLELASYRVESDAVCFELVGEPAEVELVGPSGQVLDRRRGVSGRLVRPKGVTGWVRLRARDARDRRLWTQPFWSEA
ncbi:MAG: PHP domain-containing protein, partial [Chloroflexi bacterium]|nr:PHP domain-containing protein [Chloroflexota bacterium]